jgi:hypothetical protein
MRPDFHFGGGLVHTLPHPQALRITAPLVRKLEQHRTTHRIVSPFSCAAVKREVEEGGDRKSPARRRGASTEGAGARLMCPARGYYCAHLYHPACEKDFKGRRRWYDLTCRIAAAFMDHPHRLSKKCTPILVDRS